MEKITFTQILHEHKNVPLFSTQLPTSALPWDINRQEPQPIKTQPLSVCSSGSEMLDPSLPWGKLITHHLASRKEALLILTHAQ